MRKLKQSSLSMAWLVRAKKIVAPPALSGGDRLDLVLPRGWPESEGLIFWRQHQRGDLPLSGEVRHLSELPANLRRGQVYVWTPAADSMLTSVTLPTRSRRKLMQALPYALEDRLLGDPDSLHFAYRNESDGSLSVAITARERVRTWMEHLTGVGIQPSVLCPATLMVPWAIDCWSLAFAENEALVRTGSASGFVTPLSQAISADGGMSPPPLLTASLQDAAQAQKTPDYLVVFNPPTSFDAQAWGDLLHVPMRIEKFSLWERSEDPLAPLNLLQGQFEPQGKFNNSIRPYLPAAAMLLLWLLGNIVFDLGELWKLHRQDQAYANEMRTLLLSTFPETKTVLDPAAQLQRGIDALLSRTGHRDRDLLPLLAKTASALRADGHARLRNLQYADQGLTLELTWPAPASPDAFKSALEAAGVHAEVLAMTPRAGDVDGRLRLIPSATKAPARSPS